MIACLDVQYSEDVATAAAVVFPVWESTEATATYTVSVLGIGAYEPGRFYERELQPLLEVIDCIQQPIDIFVIDAYCYLSEERSPGLGYHLWEALGRTKSVIGVAKTRYGKSAHAVELFRAGSKRPLYVTALGMDYQSASECIARMAGEFRHPALLKAVDRLSRGTNKS